MYSGVALVNKGNTPESGWIHPKVGIRCVLFMVGPVIDYFSLYCNIASSFGIKVMENYVTLPFFAISMIDQFLL